MNGAGLAILLSAESLLGTRSGVGRMTLQIANELSRSPLVGGFELMLHGVPSGTSLLQPTDAPGKTRNAAVSALLLQAASVLAGAPLLTAIRARRVRRGMNRAAAAIGGRTGSPVVYHEPNLIAQPFDGVTVVTVNDLSWRLPDRLHPKSRVEWIERRLPGSLAQAARLVAISSFTADEVVRQLGVSRTLIDVVPLAPSEVFRTVGDAVTLPVLARHGLSPCRYVLAVSTLEPRKNFDRLLAAHARLPGHTRDAFPLAVAGGKGWGNALDGAPARAALAEGRLKLLGHVSDHELTALYGRAAVFAYPSLYEGFGLPILEAMACGAPVLTSTTTACAETAGEAAFLVDPLDVERIASGLAAIIDDRSLSGRLAQAGQEHARHFTWRHTVERLTDTWLRAAGQTRPDGPEARRA